MSITLTFVDLVVELTLKNSGLLFLLFCSRLLRLMSFLCEEIWVLDLLDWRNREGLDIKAL